MKRKLKGGSPIFSGGTTGKEKRLATPGKADKYKNESWTVLRATTNSVQGK